LLLFTLDRNEDGLASDLAEQNRTIEDAVSILQLLRTANGSRVQWPAAVEADAN
jgi:hypothetical protein